MSSSETMASPGGSAAPQSRFLALWLNPVGKKAVMAVTGVVLFVFTLVHMAGNLQAFKGAPALDHYAELLRVSMPFLWFTRIVLLTAFLLHVVAGAQLWFAKRAARAIPYQDYRPQVSSAASRGMMVSGLLILLFVLFHLADLTVGVPGVATGDFREGSVFANLVASLSRGVVGAFYVAAVVGLGFHLWHGLWSVTQSLGFAHRDVAPGIQRAAIFFAVLLAVGFSAVPLAILFGLVA
ncbi:MAG: succinate dehydrogenase cytochrome b subunit [Anaeromyxobacteraceae bacterium]